MTELQPILSPLLTNAAIPHAFSTRAGGVSPAPFDSLNFGNPSDIAHDRRDPRDHIRANFDRLLAAIAAPGRTLIQVHQVHAGDVHLADASTSTGPDPRADAIITADPAALAVVRIADCAPVLIATPDGALVAAVHAGWRGVIANIVAHTIAKMRQLGAKSLLAAVGPCIGPNHFEVGPEVVAEFSRAFPSGTPVRAATDPPARAAGKAFVDLKEALRLQLAVSGVNDIDILPHCTVRDAHLFFSHRRDQGLTGRMVGLIGPR